MSSSGTTGVRGANLGWSRNGEGSAFVWGHGLTSSRAGEDEFGFLDFAELASAASVIRYDARGHGESELTDDLGGYAWDQMALDQIALCDALGVNTWVAGGASLGAATAIHAAVAAPERITALVLVIPPTAWETRAAQTAMYEQMAQIIEKRGLATLAAATPPPPPDPFTDDPAWDQRRIDQLATADPVQMATLFRGAQEANLPERDTIRTISVPALILAWSGDSGHPVSSAEELDHLLPQSSLHVASTPDELATWTSRVEAFLSETDSDTLR